MQLDWKSFEDKTYMVHKWIWVSDHVNVNLRSPESYMDFLPAGWIWSEARIEIPEAPKKRHACLMGRLFVDSDTISWLDGFKGWQSEKVNFCPKCGEKVSGRRCA